MTTLLLVVFVIVGVGAAVVSVESFEPVVILAAMLVACVSFGVVAALVAGAAT